MDELNEKLSEEILDELEKLKDLKPGSDQHTDAVKSVSELYKLAIEQNKNETEACLKAEQLKDAAEAELKQTKERRISLFANAGISLVTLAATLLHENGLAMKCLKFEETGSFQSLISKGVFGKIFRKR